jgi:hypothetical protein
MHRHADIALGLSHGPAAYGAQADSQTALNLNEI